MDEIKIGSIVRCKIHKPGKLKIDCIFIGRVDEIPVPFDDRKYFRVVIKKIIKNSTMLLNRTNGIRVYPDEAFLLKDPSVILKDIL